MDIIKFEAFIGRLKDLERTGWVRSKIPKPESVAEHIMATAMLTMLFAEKRKMNQLKAIKMALIHDVGEAIIGDLVAVRGRSTNATLLRKKREIELKAIKQIFGLVDKKELVDLFEEMEEGKTKEAKLVQQLDKLEMVLQAHQYEKKYRINLNEFYQTGFFKIKDKELRKILEKLYATRPKGMR